MNQISFSQRARALEDLFFKRVDFELREKLRKQMAEKEAKEALRQASGLDNDKLLEELVRIGITPETLAAVTLIPLIRMAWADGKISDAERYQILAAERDAGIDEKSPCHQLLEQWLTERPDRELFKVWQDYVHAMRESQLDPEGAKLLGHEIINRARRLAMGSDSALGMEIISPSESRVLKEIEETLQADQ